MFCPARRIPARHAAQPEPPGLLAFRLADLRAVLTDLSDKGA
jgi:hypothetical protein